MPQGIGRVRFEIQTLPIIWIPGHSRVKGNERADELAHDWGQNYQWYVWEQRLALCQVRTLESGRVRGPLGENKTARDWFLSNPSKSTV